MLKNYFIIARRNFWRNKIFSLINIMGLSIGISAALVIYLIGHYEFSFDQFEKGRNRLYRVATDMQFARVDIYIKSYINDCICLDNIELSNNKGCIG